MTKTCETHSIIVDFNSDMFKRCPYDKTMTRENMAPRDYALAVFEGRVSNPQKGWEERRRQFLMHYQATPLEADKSLFWDLQEYTRFMANHELVLKHINELLEDPPSWIGCSDGKIVVGETQHDVLRELENCSYPLLLIDVVS